MIPCLIILHSFGGGAENVALDLARRLDPARFEVSLACTRHLPALARQVPEHLPFSMPASKGLWAALRHGLRLRIQARRGVVLGSLELQSIFWAALLAPGRAVAWLHKDVEGYLARKPKWYGRLYTSLLGWALPRCRATACVSQGILDSSARLWPRLRPSLRLLWNPVDTEAVRQRGVQALPESLQACFTRPVVLAVGRLEPQKAYHLLLQAHALLLQGQVAHNLCILGEGSERARLEADVQRLGIADSVYLPGFMDPCPAMARAAVLAVSSDFEGLPLNMVEALSLGLPIAAFDCPSGPRELLADGKFGLLTPPGQVEALADALASVLAYRPEEAARAAGRQRAEDFAPQATVGAWERLLAGE